MRDKMLKYFSANSTRRHVDVLDVLTDQYNNKVHSSIRMTPVEASVKKNRATVWRNLYPDFSTTEDNVPKYSVGDKVRITKRNKTFKKGYTPRWTEEVFTISKIQYTDPPTYKVTDYNGDEIQGTFYEQKLQKTNQEIYRIEKIIRRRGNKSLVTPVTPILSIHGLITR